MVRLAGAKSVFVVFYSIPPRILGVASNPWRNPFKQMLRRNYFDCLRGNRAF